MSVVNHGLRWTLVAWLPFTAFQLRGVYRDVAAWLRWRRQRREASLAAAFRADGGSPSPPLASGE